MMMMAAFDGIEELPDDAGDDNLEDLDSDFANTDNDNELDSELNAFDDHYYYDDEDDDDEDEDGNLERQEQKQLLMGSRKSRNFFKYEMFY